MILPWDVKALGWASLGIGVAPAAPEEKVGDEEVGPRRWHVRLWCAPTAPWATFRPRRAVPVVDEEEAEPSAEL